MSDSFKVYVGIAVEDRQLKSRELKVYLRSMTPYSSGELTDNTRKEQFSITNENGEKASSSVNTTNCVTADYFGLITNRAFPPDIVKGEQLLIFQLADEDKYYWLPMGRDDNLRKGELLRFAISDSMAGGGELNEQNTYFVEMDTKIAKRIRIQTAKANGEAFEYQIILDAQNNFLAVHDDVGNSFTIKSDENDVSMTNGAGSTVNMKGPDINILAPRNIFIRAGKTLYLHNPVFGGRISRQGSVFATNQSFN